MKFEHVMCLLGVLALVHALLAQPNLNPTLRSVLQKVEIKEITGLFRAALA
jgi:hypothetical protein